MVAIAPTVTRSFMSVVERDAPAVADRAEPLRVRDAHVGEVHLVELGVAGELAQRAHLDAGRLHVDEEVGEAPVLGRLGIGAGEQQAPAWPRGPAWSRPSARSPPTRRRRARPGCRAPARSEPAPGSLNSWHQISSHGEQRPQVALDAARRCRGARSWARHADADRVDVEVRRRPGGIEALVHDPLLRRVGRETSGALRRVDPRQSGVEARAQERRGCRCRRRVVPEELLDVSRDVVVGHFGPPGDSPLQNNVMTFARDEIRLGPGNSRQATR